MAPIRKIVGGKLPHTTDKGDDSEGERKVDRGVKTCPTCRGAKYTETSLQEQDGDGTYDGAGEHTCT